MVIEVQGIESIVPPSKTRVEVEQGGEKLAFSFSPLTAEQVEQIRAVMPTPKPPEKDIEGLTVQQKAQRHRQNLATTYVDYNDEAYLVALGKYQEALSFEMLRTSLGWDVPLEEFSVALKSRLTEGNLRRLIDAVHSQTFRLDDSLVDRFLGTSPLSTLTGENS